MKLFGVANANYFIASLDAHHFVSMGTLYVDGGQPGTNTYAGYSKTSQHVICAEVPQSYPEIITNYNGKNTAELKHGVWKREDVTLIAESEWPDTNSWDWKLQTTVWGTYGKSGKDKLKFILLNETTTEHLYAILDLTKFKLVGHELPIVKTITYILKTRNTIQADSSPTIDTNVILG